MAKAGHVAAGYGAFKDKASGRYYVAMCNDAGFEVDGAERSFRGSWWSAVDLCENAGRLERKAHAAYLEKCAELGRLLTEEARRTRGQWPKIRNMALEGQGPSPQRA